MERPETLLTFSDYKEDITIRWQIHSYEWNKLIEDVQKAYDFLFPLLVKSKNHVMTAYKREFKTVK
jgi:hypothetical protein